MEIEPTVDLRLPRRPRGRQSAAASEEYDLALWQWCKGIKQINDTLDIQVGVRGWCYLLEQHGSETRGCSIAHVIEQIVGLSRLGWPQNGHKILGPETVVRDRFPPPALISCNLAGPVV